MNIHVIDTTLKKDRTVYYIVSDICPKTVLVFVFFFLISCHITQRLTSRSLLKRMKHAFKTTGNANAQHI